jgi:hypothetical protein
MNRWLLLGTVLCCLVGCTRTEEPEDITRAATLDEAGRLADATFANQAYQYAHFKVDLPFGVAQFHFEGVVDWSVPALTAVVSPTVEGNPQTPYRIWVNSQAILIEHPELPGLMTQLGQQPARAGEAALNAATSPLHQVAILVKSLAPTSRENTVLLVQDGLSVVAVPEGAPQGAESYQYKSQIWTILPSPPTVMRLDAPLASTGSTAVVRLDAHGQPISLDTPPPADEIITEQDAQAILAAARTTTTV